MSTADSVLTQERKPVCAPGTALVVAVSAKQDGYRLDDGRAVYDARRATSCLVLPVVGDTVACMAGAEGDQPFWVTAVLQRSSEDPLTVALPPGASIASAGGRLTLAADALHLQAQSLAVEGERACLSVEQVLGVGSKASWSYGAVKLTADLVESFAARLLQFSRWSQRVVDGPDQVRSRQMDWRAEQTMQLQAQVVIADAQKLLKADGEQIHLG